MSNSKELRLHQLDPLRRLDHGCIPTLLQLLFLGLFAVLLVAFLVQVPKVPSTQGQERLYQELTQLKARVDSLCHPCPWDWTLFERNCYFFSKSKRNWTDSVTACQDVGAQLVIIETDQEQSFLRRISQKKGRAWVGLSDLKHEGSWQWVDCSPLLFSFRKYWNPGEPNNVGDEDCVEFDNDWNDAQCGINKFWICKKSVTSCSSI